MSQLCPATPSLTAVATVRPWTLGRYQALGFAKVWTGTARLPSQSRLWDDYHNNNHWGGGSKVVFGTLEEECECFGLDPSITI